MNRSRYKKASSRITKRSRIRNIFGLVLKTGLPVAVLVGLVFLLRADFLQVKNFEIIGTETISPENIKNTASNFISGNKLFIIPKSDILLLNKEKMATALVAAFPRIEKVEVSKKFFSQQVELKVIERKADFLWCSAQNECFSMGRDGFIFEKSNFAEASLDKSENKITFKGILERNPLMKDFATPEKMQNYLNFIEVFKNAGFNVSSIDIESSDKAVAKTNINNFASNIIFNPEEKDLSLVAQNVILLIKETQIKNPSARFQYIDARFGNKFFYKLL